MHSSAVVGENVWTTGYLSLDGGQFSRVVLHQQAYMSLIILSDWTL